jgi:uncharacterized protein
MDIDGGRIVGAAENKKLMQEIFAGVSAGNRTLFVDHLAENVTMTITGRYSWSQTFCGKAALISGLYDYLRTVLAERRTIPHRFIADDDFVVVEARGDMVTRTGARYDNDYCLVYRLENGKIVEIREYCDSALTESVLGPYPASRRGRDKA